ncbi:MAG: hypothetical protein LQ346_008900, partial [Caloplaca aetnensis]
MATRYKYSPLSEKARHIRLLTLLPNHFDAPIRITLRITQLAKDTEFEALSYAWGSASDPEEISVVAKEPKNRRFWHPKGVKLATLPVTENLFEALRHLRLRDRPRVLWIDAICVDQQNLKERCTQVLRMPDIYTQAKRVVVWLGPESYNSALAMKAIEDIGSRIMVNWYLRTITTTSKEGSDPPSREFVDDLLQQSELWLAFKHLLNRPYFRRLWVVQEIYLAKDRAHVVCGCEQTSCERFFNAIYYIFMVVDLGESDPLESSEHAVNLGFVRQSKSYRLEHLMSATRFCQCFDDRDRVYALLSLVPAEQRYGICPDYTKTVPEVFQELILKKIAATASLRMLRHCDIDCRMPHVPTWVPNWSSGPDIERLPINFASLAGRAHAHYDSQGVLTVTGVCMAAVQGIRANIPRRVPEGNRDEAASTLRELISLSSGFDDNIVHSDSLHSVCRVLCANVFSERFIPADYDYPTFQRARKYLMEVDAWSLDALAQPPEIYRPYVGAINRILKERSLIVTTDGRLGLAPEATQPGDKICVLLGCESPLLLRPDRSGNHVVVGECYIDGMMSGEALLGELPRNWTLAWKYFPKVQGHVEIFLDGTTGQTALQDPRLGPLPAGWGLDSHMNMDAYNWYYNERTGEDTEFDPRLEPDALRERGVE